MVKNFSYGGSSGQFSESILSDDDEDIDVKEIQMEPGFESVEDLDIFEEEDEVVEYLRKWATKDLGSEGSNPLREALKKHQKNFKTQICFAESMGYLPVQLVHFNQGKKQFSAEPI